MMTSVLAVLAAAAVTVSDSDGLVKALGKVQADAAAPHEIVLKPGRYFVPQTIELKGAAVSGLVLRAERRGTAELSGGRRLTGWTKEPDSDFWYADVPGFAGDGEFFRMLVKEGHWVELATYPGKGRRLEHTARFTAALLPNLVGHWSRKPTDDENRLMPYAVADLPDAMDLENADVHLFHMWDDSMCRVESVDRAKHVLRTVETPNWPMGAQEKFEYEILNVREGAAPGEWYMDRRKGRVFYRALPGENVTKLDFVIPNLTTVLRIADAKNVTLDGIVVSGSGPKVKNRPGYGGCGVAPAVEIRGLEDLVLKCVRITNVGGGGLSGGCVRFRATDCVFAFSGACAVFLSGRDNVIENCRITDAGKLFRGSSGTFISGQRVVVRKNEFARIPYSGIIGFGDFNRFEDNDIHHVMQVLHDGAAIYGLHVHGVMRGNSVRDVVALGKGFGVHAYYADEGSHDSVIEGNYAEGMPVPIHNHMTSGIIVRNNKLVNENGDFCLSFERSINGVFSNNTVVCGGELQTKWLDSVPVWSGNVANDKPWNPARPQQPKKDPLEVPRAKVAPKVDGTFAEGEWPGDFLRIDVTPDRHQTGYSSELVRFMWDDENLYVSMLAANFGSGTISLGSTWGKDDGVKLDFRNGREILGFNDGTTVIRPDSLAKAVRIVALGKGKTGHSNPNLARYEMAIPWSALGVTPKAGLELPFNAMSFMSEYKVMKCWDGLDADPKLVLR